MLEPRSYRLHVTAVIMSDNPVSRVGFSEQDLATLKNVCRVEVPILQIWNRPESEPQSDFIHELNRGVALDACGRNGHGRVAVVDFS